MAQQNTAGKLPHNLIMEDRKKLAVSGVRDMDSFDEQTVVLYTDWGELTVRGEGLHMEQLSIESGDVQISGTVHSLQYTENRAAEKSFFGRLFRS